VGGFGGAAGELQGPQGVAVVGSGDVYAADTGNNRIVEYSQSGVFVRAFGADVGGAGIDVCTTSCQVATLGSAAGELRAPKAVAVAGSGEVYVADGNNRIVEYSQSGAFVRAFGADVGGAGIDVCTTSCQAGSFGGAAGELDYGVGVAVAGSGDVYVSDLDNYRIDEFSQSGVFVRAFGLNVGGAGVDVCTTSCAQASSGGAAGELDKPNGVGVGGSGDVFVSDLFNQRIDEWGPSKPPPRVKITHTSISQSKHQATFRFIGFDTTTGLQCALIKSPKDKHASVPKPHFSACKSPKTYTHLRAGEYIFEVRAASAAGTGPAARKNFRVS
jgi:hypothetical protein